MKPIEDMTTAEVNREIAKLCGWKCYRRITDYYEQDEWTDPSGREGDPPDYCGSWDAAGRLLDDLLDWLDKEPVTISIVTESDGVRLRLYRNKGEEIAVSVKGQTRKEAISRAWLAWRRETQNETD